MLKFRNKKGELRYVLRDADSQPKEVLEIVKEILQGHNLNEELDEETIKRLTTQGVSQDDLKIFKGEYNEME